MPAIDWPNLAMWTAISISAGLIIYHGVASYYYVKYYILRKEDAENWKCQPKRFLPKRLHRRSILLSTFNMIVGGLITGPLLYGIAHGMQTPIYFSVSDYGWTYTILSTIGLFIILDGIAFYVHWGLHLPFFYKRFHRSHHSYVATTPFVTAAIHPAAFIALQVATYIPLFIIPFHAVSIGLVLFYILVFNIIDHSGVSLKSHIPWQAASNYHDDHHALFHVNFGQHLMIFDRLHGTLRREGRSYGVNTYGGKGIADKHESELPPFFSYE